MRDLKMEKLCSQKKWDKIYDYISNKVCALTQEEQAELFLQWSGCSIPQRILCDAPDITTFLPFFPINKQYHHGRTALYFAVVFNNYAAARRLLENGADPNIADVTGQTPAFFAKDSRMIDLLEKFGADFDVKDLSGSSIFDASAAKRGTLAAVQYLQQKKETSVVQDPHIYQNEQVSNNSYYQEFADTYKQMYEIYDLSNQICWNAKLPPCILEVPQRFMVSNAAAVAEPCGLCHNGIIYPKISFKKSTLDSCLNYWTGILLHEMIHIWEHSTNGGSFLEPVHGKIFKDEAKRIGLYNSDLIEENTLADKVLTEIMQKFPDFNENCINLAKTKIKHAPDDDVNFFAKQYIPTFKK